MTLEENAELVRDANYSHGWLDHRPRPHPVDVDEPECRDCNPASTVLVDEGADRVADLYRRTGGHRDRPDAR